MRKLIKWVLYDQVVNSVAINKLESLGFPTEDDLNFITYVVQSDDLESTMKEHKDVLDLFRKKCLYSLIPAESFFQQLKMEVWNGVNRIGPIVHYPQMPLPTIPFNMEDYGMKLRQKLPPRLSWGVERPSSILRPEPESTFEFMVQVVKDVLSDIGASLDDIYKLSNTGFPSEDDMNFITFVLYSDDMESTLEEHKNAVELFRKMRLHFLCSPGKLFAHLKLKACNAAELTGETSQGAQLVPYSFALFDAYDYNKKLTEEYAKRISQSKDRDDKKIFGLPEGPYQFKGTLLKLFNFTASSASENTVVNGKNVLGKFVPAVPKKSSETRSTPYSVVRRTPIPSKPKKVDAKEADIKLDIERLSGIELKLEKAIKDLNDMNMDGKE